MERLINLLSIKAHASRTAAVDPLQKFKFRMTIPGLPSGVGFKTVSGLSQEVEVAEYDEGGYGYTHKLPGRIKVGEVTAERGVFADDSIRDLLKQTITNPNARNTIIFEILDRFGETAKTYKLAEAWVSKWEGSDADASSSDAAIEKLTIQFEYFLD